MSVKLQNEHIKLSEVVCSRYCQTTVENDVIVPDIKPDILKILQVSNSVVITQKNIQPDKVYLQGIIRVNILYLPDNDDLGAVKAINANLDFNHTIEAKGAKPGMALWVDSECEPPEHTTVNSRKLNIRSKISFGVRLSQSSEIELATGIGDDEPIQLKETQLKIYNPCIDAERDIIIRENLEIPAGKPSIREALKLSVSPSSTELRLLGGKAVAKGEIKICTLYCGECEQCSIEYTEHSVSFSEILEIDGLSETMNGEIDYTLKDLNWEICQDPDGDKRIISCEIVLTAAVCAFETVECHAIEDAYGLESNIKLEKSAYTIEQLVENTAAQSTIREQINIPDYLPEIQQLCDCSAAPTIESITVDSGCVTVSGCANCNILYLSGDESAPISGFNHILSFSHSFEIQNADPNCLCDAKAEADYISCTISSGKCLEIRAIIAIDLKVMRPQSAELVSAIECVDSNPLPKFPSMIVYFVQNGDTLWSIAKRYHISVDTIKAANELESDLIKPGQRILIFR